MRKKQELELLEELLDLHKIPFLYFGTYALKILYEEKLTVFQPPDVDILIHGNEHTLLGLLFSLDENQWDVHVWNESFSSDWTANFLQGKWYVRIRKGPLLCDLSFEYPYLDFVRALQSKVLWKSHPMCCLEDIWFLKLLKDEKRAYEFAQIYRLEIPKQSIVRCSRWKKEGKC